MRLLADASTTIELTKRELQLLSDLIAHEIEGRAEHGIDDEGGIESLAQKLADVTSSMS